MKSKVIFNISCPRTRNKKQKQQQQHEQQQQKKVEKITNVDVRKS